MDDYAAGAILGSLLMGAGCGLLPLLVGLATQKAGLGVGGFICCVVAGLVAGIIGALPAAIIFLVIIVSSKSPTKE